MRKEVKRSLLFWPATASATITAMSWLMTIAEPVTPVRNYVQTVGPSVEAVVLDAGIARIGDAGIGALATEIKISARSEHGARAMTLPKRVAKAFGANDDNLQAPVIDVQRELAGLVEPTAEADNTAECTVEITRRAPLAIDTPSSTTEREVVRLETTIPPQTLENLRNRQSTPAPAPLFVGPVRPDNWIEPANEPEEPRFMPRSLLPDSIRALGRRILPTFPDVELTPSLASPEAPAIEIVPPLAPKPLAPEQLPAERSQPVAPSIADSSPQPVEATIDTESDISPAEAADEKADEIAATRPDDEPTAAAAQPVAERATEVTAPVGWPITKRLDEQLEALSALAMNQTSVPTNQLVSASNAVSPIVRWSEDVSENLKQLRSLPRLGDPRAGRLIEQLSDLAVSGARSAETLDNRQQQIDWLRATYAVSRRVAVWQRVWDVSRSQETEWTAGRDAMGTDHSIGQAIDAVRTDLVETGDEPGWRRYLLLDDIDGAGDQVTLEERTVLAQRFLSRLDWHRLAPEQKEWLQRQSVTELAALIRPWAQDAVDYVSLLGQIERQESDAIDLAAIDIASAVQTLRFAKNPKAVQIAQAMDTHYRNANVRMALSQVMLQRILPTVEPRSVPVRTSVFGSRVRGMSRVESDLRIALTPSRDRWLLDLQAVGNVRTQSTGLNGPVAIRTAGNSDFVAKTPIEVTRQGIRLGDANAKVQGRTQLRAIRSDYDGWPLIGSLVRSMAADRYESLASRSNRIANDKIRVQIESELKTELDDRLTEATSRLNEMLLGPLGKLKLDPQVTDMQTTDQRLLARYRLAGDWQLAAFTARPRAPRTSLMSIQVHQSAINNTLEQLVPRAETLTLAEMVRGGAATFGQAEITLPEDIPEDVTIQFAPTRPITVEIEDGQLWVTMRIMKLSRNERLDLTRFIVRARLPAGIRRAPRHVEPRRPLADQRAGHVDAGTVAGSRHLQQGAVTQPAAAPDASGDD